MNKVIIYGEAHEVSSFKKEVEMIKYLMDTIGIDYLIQETAFDYVLLNRQAIQRKIRNKDWMIGPDHYKMGIKFNLPIIGMDLSPEERDHLHNEVDTDNDYSPSFTAREDRMVKVIEEYRKKGNCFVTVGDTHLRTIETRQLGRASPLWTKYKDDENVFIFRIDPKEREIDEDVVDKRIHLYKDLKSLDFGVEERGSDILSW